MIGRASRRERRRVKIKPDYDQLVIRPTASREHYVVINDCMCYDPDTQKYYWHSSQITWRTK